MHLTRLAIQNYKSLRNIAVEPTPLSVLVGPNASGKTNFADALDFLGITYRWGLEQAVAAKGGYENICYRSGRRTRAPIRFHLYIDLSQDDGRAAVSSLGDQTLTEYPRLTLEHLFEIHAQSEGAGASFVVAHESVLFWRESQPGRALPTFGVVAHSGQAPEILGRPEDLEGLPGFDFAAIARTLGISLSEELSRRVGALGSTDLALPVVERSLSMAAPFTRKIGALRIFQINPRTCREAGVPTPNAELDRFGGNLPAALDHLKKNHPESYTALLETTRKVLPTVESLGTGFTHTKTLALFLRERGFGRPWPAEDISGGTLQTIALLVALFDPRSKIVVIEEPENSIHPWALRNFVEAARLASTQKQIFLTTHSPVLIDQLRPEEVWVVRRPGAETLIDPLPHLDPTITEAWGQGKFTLSEYLDSGALPDAVPAAGSGA